MPENNFNNFQNNGNNLPNQMPVQPKIEIPQEYYDKLAEEQRQKQEKEQQDMIQEQENKEANARLSKVFATAIINGLIIFILFHVAYKIKDIALLAIPVITVIGTIISSISAKKESTYPTSVLIGGMIGAIVSYVISLTNEAKADYWMHFAISCAIAAFVCYIVCSLIHNLIANRENVKALGWIGTILFLAAIVGVPYYFYQKNPEEIYKTIFMKTTEVHAETELEFIVKTLKNRYNVEFECQSERIKSNVERGRKITQRICTPIKAKETQVTVKSIIYKEEKNQYVVIDNYLDIKKLDDFRIKHAKNIMESLNAKKTNFYIYPKENCTFIGNCADCDEYQDNYANEVNIDKQYAASSRVNYEKILNQDVNTTVNEGEFKYIIDIVGTFNEITDYNGIINSILTYLNNQGLKNTFGYEITLYNSIDNNGETTKEVYKVNGKTNTEQVFKDPVEVK